MPLPRELGRSNGTPSAKRITTCRFPVDGDAFTVVGRGGGGAGSNATSTKTHFVLVHIVSAQ